MFFMHYSVRGMDVQSTHVRWKWSYAARPIKRSEFIVKNCRRDDDDVA